jgi:hypothetical protein
MTKLKRFRPAVCVITFTLVAVMAETSHAATFWDWLWGRSPYYQSRHFAGSGATPGYPAQLPVASPAPFEAPVPTAYSNLAPAPTTQYLGQPPMTTADPSCQPVYLQAQPCVAAYAPRPAYRHSWLRVPVTRYRPVAYTNPWTGAATSQYQPCNTQTWQLQRVPATGFQSVFSWLHAARLQPQQVAAFPGFVGQPAVSAGQCAPCVSSLVPSGAAAPVPYYTPGGQFQGQGGLVPVPAQPPSTGASAVPADKAPVLQSAPSSASVAPNRGTSNFSGPIRRSMPRVVPSGRTVVPIPDPESGQQQDPNKVIAPPLLNPQNQTAARGRAPRAVTPISWAEPADRAPAARPNDGGWKSVRGR